MSAASGLAGIRNETSDQAPSDAIARELGLSRERVRQLEQTGLAHLARELEGVVNATADELSHSA